MIQVPFFTGMMEASHGAVVWLCTRAAIGDANIALFAYGIAAAATKDGFWIQGRWRRHVLARISHRSPASLADCAGYRHYRSFAAEIDQ